MTPSVWSLLFWLGRVGLLAVFGRAAGLPSAQSGPGSSNFAADRYGQSGPVVFASACRKMRHRLWGARLSCPVESPGGTLPGLYVGVGYVWDRGSASRITQQMKLELLCSANPRPEAVASFSLVFPCSSLSLVCVPRRSG